jgi:hypothetical protein
MNIVKLLCGLFLSVLYCKADPNTIISDGLSLPISQKSVDLICYYEIGGGQKEFEKYYSKPIVPAWQTTSSGVTVGIGVDCGYLTKEQMVVAFTGILTDDEIKLLQSVSGYKGRSAYYNALPKVKYKVSLTWDQAQAIFNRFTLPSFTKQTANAFALTPERLHPHSNGALVSLVYNRGPSLANTDSRKEMRWIKYNISINREDRVPYDIKSMKRLWGPSLKGLWLRRDAESKLFQEGLDANND